MDAFQGVAVQAVICEYLIRYSELIFSELPIMLNAVSRSPCPADMTTSNLSLASTRTRQELRPKSLAVSTPAKLLTLEEARSRALLAATAFEQPQRYIDVGGGANTMPPKYHTVIELSGRKAGGSMKQRKSLLGWRAIFVGGKNKADKKKTDKVPH